MHALTRYVHEEGIVATCSGCQERFTASAWLALPLVGRMDYEEAGDQRIELRNCTCREEGRYTHSALLVRKTRKEQIAQQVLENWLK